MTRAPLIVVALAAGALAWGCGGGTASTSDGGGGGSSAGNGGSSGSAGNGGSTGSAGRGGGSGGNGGSTGDAGRDGSAGGADGGNTTPATCHGGLTCGAGQSCGLDCMGNTGNVTGLAGPGINCSCSNGSYSCRVIYEGTAGSVPPACPAGSACTNRCTVCQSTSDAGARTCFCSADLVWVCA